MDKETLTGIKWAASIVAIGVGVAATAVAIEPHRVAWQCDSGEISSCKDLIDEGRTSSVKTPEADETITQLLNSGYGLSANEGRFVSASGTMEQLSVPITVQVQPGSGRDSIVASAAIRWESGLTEYLILESTPGGEGWNGYLGAPEKHSATVYVTRTGSNTARIELGSGGYVYLGGVYSRLQSAAEAGQRLIDQRLEEEQAAQEMGEAIVGGIIRGIFGF